MSDYNTEIPSVITSIMGRVSPEKHKDTLKASTFDTPIGSMLAIADEKKLYILEFFERKGLEQEIERLQKKYNYEIIAGKTDPIKSIESEIKAYFTDKLKKFKTPIHIIGTPFQKQVWNELLKIPYGITRSYLEQAKAIKKETAYRAVANANGANQLAIIIPCHRIINNNGNLGGYGGGIDRKKWLLEHEKKNMA